MGRLINNNKYLVAALVVARVQANGFVHIATFGGTVNAHFVARPTKVTNLEKRELGKQMSCQAPCEHIPLRKRLPLRAQIAPDRYS